MPAGSTPQDLALPHTVTRAVTNITLQAPPPCCAHRLSATLISLLPSAQECGATASLPLLTRPGRLSVRAAFRGHEITEELTVHQARGDITNLPHPCRDFHASLHPIRAPTQGQAVLSEVAVTCSPERVPIGGHVTCTLSAHDKFGNRASTAELKARP